MAHIHGSHHISTGRSCSRQKEKQMQRFKVLEQWKGSLSWIVPLAGCVNLRGSCVLGGETRLLIPFLLWALKGMSGNELPLRILSHLPWGNEIEWECWWPWRCPSLLDSQCLKAAMALSGPSAPFPLGSWGLYVPSTLPSTQLPGSALCSFPEPLIRTPFFQLRWLFLDVSSLNETKANFPPSNLGDFTVVSMSGWELNELIQPRLKLAVRNQLIDRKKGQFYGETSGGYLSFRPRRRQGTEAFRGCFWTQNCLYEVSPSYLLPSF